MSAVAIAAIDPYGLSTRTDASLEAAFDRAVASRYPSWQNDDIAIIVSTYEDVQHGLKQPTPYDDLANAVDMAAHAHSPAIFLDYDFEVQPSDPTDSPKALINAIIQARQANVAVLTYRVNRNIFPQLATLVWQVGLDGAPEHPADYNLTGKRGAFSPAAALYLAACSAKSRFRRFNCDATLIKDFAAHGARKRVDTSSGVPALALEYGATFPAHQAYYSGPDEEARCRQPHLAEMLRSGLMNRRANEPCSMHLTIPITVLGYQQSVKDMTKQLEGRLILVGQGWRLGDDHDWPGVGSLPGVAFHAAALDNILTRGHRYHRWPPVPIPLQATRLSWDKIIQLLLIGVPPLLVLAYVRAGMATGGSPGETLGTAIQGLAILVAAAVLPMAIAWIVSRQAHWPPAPALTIVAVGLPLTNYLCQEDMAGKLAPLNTTASAGAILAIFGALIVLAFASPSIAHFAFAAGLAVALFCVPFSLSLARTACRRWIRNIALTSHPGTDTRC